MLAARVVPRCMGSWEYLCDWGEERSWETEAAVGAEDKARAVGATQATAKATDKGKGSGTTRAATLGHHHLRSVIALRTADA